MSNENAKVKIRVPVASVLSMIQEGIGLYYVLCKYLFIYLIVHVGVTFLAMPLCNITSVNLLIHVAWIMFNVFHLYFLEGLDKYISAKPIRYCILFCVGSDVVEMVLRYYRDSYFVTYCSHDFYHFQHATLMLVTFVISLVTLAILKGRHLRLRKFGTI
jgi:hypothetical protein